jgi:hypothetical protein
MIINKKIESVSVLTTAEIFSDHCFADCKTIKDSQIPKSIVQINSNCFSQYSSQKVIIIPQSEIFIGDSYFEGYT